MAAKKLTLELVLLGLTLYLLRGSKTCHSSTAIVGFVISVGILFGLESIKKKAARARRIVLVGTLVFILVAPAVYFLFEAFDTTPVQFVLDATGRDLTLSDRTILWTDVLNNAANNPVLGVGFGAFWVGREALTLYAFPNWDKKTPWRPHQGHNGYIDVYVDLGLVGEALVLLMIWSALAGALKELETNFEFGRIRITFLLAILMNNLTEASLLKGTHSLWFMFLLVGLNIPRMSVSRRRGKGEIGAEAGMPVASGIPSV